jgi:hypothetical protein
VFAEGTTIVLELKGTLIMTSMDNTLEIDLKNGIAPLEIALTQLDFAKSNNLFEYKCYITILDATPKVNVYSYIQVTNQINTITVNENSIQTALTLGATFLDFSLTQAQWTASEVGTEASFIMGSVQILPAST